MYILCIQCYLLCIIYYRYSNLDYSNYFYYFCKKKIDLDTVKYGCVDILKRNETVFLQYRQMLTPAQWNYLIALAKEGEVQQITAQKFIAKYEIGTPANSRRICKSLLGKELVLEETSKNQITYKVYDVFLSRWLASEY